MTGLKHWILLRIGKAIYMSNCAIYDKTRHRQHSKTKVLIYQEAWGRGGIENFVMELLRHVDIDEFEIELMSAYDWYDGFDEEIEERGVTRVAVFPGTMPNHIKRLLAGTSAWSKRLADHDVDVVHINAMNGITLAYAWIAKRRGVPIRIVHSHNNSFSGGARKLKLIVHTFSRALWGAAPTCRLACSDAAGRYLFGNKEYVFLPNGIDVERFRFKPDVRNSMRTNLGVAEDTILLGSIGRLSYQKNPLFTVGVLSELVSRNINCHLLLVGDGELADNVAAAISKQGLDNRYTHLPSVSNPEGYYCAMDVFLMPSVFEGLGYALIEAQCSGLPCMVSEAIQPEACITGLVMQLNLKNPAAWCDQIIKSWKDDDAAKRYKYADDVASAGLSLTNNTGMVYRAWK